MSKALDRSQRAGSDPIQIGNTKLVTDSNNDLTVQDTSSNTKKLIASEVHIGTGSDKVILKRSSSDGKLQLQTTDGSSTADSEVSSDSSSGSGTTVYANIAAMIAVSSPTAGSQALVTANKGLYIFNGSGWYKIATVNTSPVLVSPATGTDITMGTDGVATSIELVATDVDEGTTLQYSYTVSTGSLTNGGGTTATVTSSATSNGTYSALVAGASTTNRFIKVTPTTTASYAGDFSLQFSISDGTNAVTTIQNFGLAFTVSGSLYFDGNGDYLSAADSDDFSLGTGDFTVEAWVWQQNSAASDSHHIINKWSSTGTGKDFILRIGESSGNKLQFLYTNNGSSEITLTGNTAIANGTWTHVAAMGISDTIKLFVDGTQQTATGTQGTIYNGTEPLAIGAQTNAGSPSQYFDGYISNARIVKGSAAYSVTTPPTIGSISLDGSGDWVTGTVTAAGTNDFTLECWFNTDTISNHDGIISIQAAELSGTAQYNGIAIAYQPSDSNYQIYYNATHVNSTVGVLPTVGKWHHAAFVRISNVTKLYIDGIEFKSVSDSYNYTQNILNIGGYYTTSYTFDGKVSDVRYVVGTGVYTGAFTPPTGKLTLTGGTYPSNTNVNTSITSGHTKLLTANESSYINDDSASSVSLTARGNAAANASMPYVSSIVVPTSPLSAITNTKFLVAKNSALVSGAATSDESGSSHGLTFVGDTVFHHATPFISTSGGSIYMDGGGTGAAASAGNADWISGVVVAPGNSDFTVECWVYLTTQDPAPYQFQSVFAIQQNAFSGSGSWGTTGFGMYFRGGTHDYVGILANGTFHTSSGNAAFLPPAATWTHVAFINTGGYSRVFVGGTKRVELADTTNYTSETHLAIGGHYSTANSTYDGYISNFRYHIGTPPYTITNGTTITPPTSALTAISGTKLLTANDSNVINDASTESVSLTANGNAIATKLSPF